MFNFIDNGTKLGSTIWVTILFTLGILISNHSVSNADNIFLDAQERAWLNTHGGEIRLAHSPDWPPMDFIGEDGKQQGMVADYVQLIEKKLNIKFKTVKVRTWEEILNLAKTRKIDLISAGQETEERKQFMIWSTPYLNLKTTIIVQKSRSGALTLDQMRGMKIGVPRKYAVGEFIRERYPYLTLTEVLTSSEGIRKVSFGEVDAMITEVPNALYIIGSEKITNLRLAGDTGFELWHGMGIRKDWPVFARIVEKALASISEKEHKRIYDKWIRLETINFYQTRTFWYGVLGVTLAVMLVVGSILLWNRTLKIQVMQRTEELRFNEKGLEALLELNEQTHISIKEVIEFAFQQMLSLTQSRFGYLAFEDQDGIVYVVDSVNDSTGKKHAVQHLSDGFNPETIGFWGDAVRMRKPLISNDYKLSNPRLTGVPKEHEPVTRYMNVPIFSDGKIVVVAGMGNKDTDYTPSDLRQLNLLAQGMWRLIQRKKSEQAIQKSEKRFRDLVENSPNGIAIIQNGAIVYRNSKQIQLMGELELFNPKLYKLIHQDDLENVKHFHKQILNYDLSQSELMFRFYPPSEQNNKETMKWVNCIVAPIDFQDKKAFLMITIDMTESKKMERLLTVQDKMASLGHVSAGIAHEIRNPLSGINIYLRTIEKHFKNPGKELKIDSSIAAIRSASQKIESVIKRVMNFAKPTEPKFDRIDINIPVMEAVKLTSFTLNKKGIEIRQILDDHLPCCYAEPHLIEEVVLNLINNAADAILGRQDRGLIQITSTCNRDKIVLSLEDNGPGIPRDLRQKIFEPFFTTKETSTGIGLSLCHRVITDHRGKIKVLSSDLGGAKFLIEIPVSLKA